MSKTPKQMAARGERLIRMAYEIDRLSHDATGDLNDWRLAKVAKMLNDVGSAYVTASEGKQS